MILMATDAAGKLHFLTTDDTVEPGPNQLTKFFLSLPKN
jgi:hypothetical protein